MDCVIINDDGLLYGGFCEGKPVWYRTKRSECVLAEEIAVKVEKQLLGLEFKCIRREAHKVSRKWVPSELAATLDFGQLSA